MADLSNLLGHILHPDLHEPALHLDQSFVVLLQSLTRITERMIDTAIVLETVKVAASAPSAPTGGVASRLSIAGQDGFWALDLRHIAHGAGSL